MSDSSSGLQLIIIVVLAQGLKGGRLAVHVLVEIATCRLSEMGW